MNIAPCVSCPIGLDRGENHRICCYCYRVVPLCTLRFSFFTSSNSHF